LDHQNTEPFLTSFQSLSEFLNAMRVSAFGPSTAVSQLEESAWDCLERHGWRGWLGWHCGLNLLPKQAACEALELGLQHGQMCL
jgi:hypothetical protein